MHHRSCASIIVYSRNLGYAKCLFRLIPFAQSSVCNLGDRSILDTISRACKRTHIRLDLLFRFVVPGLLDSVRIPGPSN
jgi:hypothetical protein